MASARILTFLFVAAMALVSATAPAQISAPLRVDTANPRYFMDERGAAVYLAGSHAWLNFQDGGFTYPPTAFNFTQYLNFLAAYNHNFIRLWTWEEAKWIQEYHGDYFFDPMPFQRTGPGTALDGRPKYDLTKFNQAYFDRLRARCIEAGSRGIYVSVMLFDGWSVMNDYTPGTADNTPFNGHPMHASNNINGINGDPTGSTNGKALHTMQLAAARAIQEAYVKKVIDTINDLNNILYEISNESFSESTAWQYHFITFIKSYEKTKAKQHPVGMTAQWPDDNTNAKLFASPADWISPNSRNSYDNNIPAADGSKVILLDTDHVFGIGGNRVWIWKSFTRGMNIPWMDMYDKQYPWDPSTDPNDARFIDARTNLGYTVAYSRRIDLNTMLPHQELSSTNFCLACTDSAKAAYLVYSEWGGGLTVDISATRHRLHVEWFNPATGKISDGGYIDGGTQRSFTPPFTGDAVLYLSSPVTSGVLGAAAALIDGLHVEQNFPNPFNPLTQIGFTIGISGHARLTVYDMKGAEVAVLLNQDVAPGAFTATWNAKNVASGIYFYRLDLSTVSAGKRRDYSETKKLLLEK